jgi:transcriptional regulator with XRE-family HTH domain
MSNQDELTGIVARNLKNLRTLKGLSLDALAKLSGVSRAMLGQIESGKSTPTISLLWKVASALEVPFATLINDKAASEVFVLKHENSKTLDSNGGRFKSRALFPFDEERKVEFYELRIAPGHEEKAEAHAPGTVENLVVSSGAVEILIEGHLPQLLNEADSILFKAESAHSYKNIGTTEARLYLVMTYAQSIGA